MNLITHNLKLKLFALLVASLLWYQVSSRDQVEREVRVPVEFVNKPERLIIANDVPGTVQVNVEGRRGLAENSDMSVLIDLRGRQPQTYFEQLDASHLHNKPADLKVIEYIPSAIRMDIEEKVENFIPVRVNVTGEPADGFEIIARNVLPAEVQVSGPRRAVEEVREAVTVPINVDGLTSTLERDAEIFLDHERVRILQDSRVRIWVVIEEERKEVHLYNVPVQIFPADAGSQLRTKGVEVVGTVPVSYLGDLDPQAFLATVTTQRLAPRRQSYRLTPEVIPPDEYIQIFRFESVGKVEVRKRR